MSPSSQTLGRMAWKTRLVIAGACSSGVLVGYDMGIIDGMVEMQTWMSDFGLGAIGSLGVRSVTLGGAVVGAVIAIPACRAGGRPYATFMGTSMTVVATAFQFFKSPDFIAMHGRLLAGMGAGCITALGPLYLAEIVKPRYRSSVIIGFFLAVCSGRMLGNGVSGATAHIPTHMSYIVPSAVTYAWALLSVASVLFITSESPYYLVTINRVEDAQKALGRIRGLPWDHHTVVDFVRKMKVLYDSKIRGFGQPTFIKLIREENRRYLFIAIALQVVKYSFGIDFLYKIGHLMMQNVGLHSPVLRHVAFGIFEATGFIASMLSVSFLSNRGSLMAGSCFMFVIMFGIIFVMMGYGRVDATTGQLITENTASAVAIAILAGTGIMFHTATWGARSWSICAEIFPAMYRPIGLPIAVAVHWLAALVSDICTTYVMKATSPLLIHITILVPTFCTGASLVSMVFVAICIDGLDNSIMVPLDVNGVELTPLPPRRGADFVDPESAAFVYPSEDPRGSVEIRDSFDLDE